MVIDPNLDILLLSIPRLELRGPLCGPALIKAVTEEAGYKSQYVDLNIDLWQRLESQGYTYLWGKDDNTFYDQDKFSQFYESTFKSVIEDWSQQIVAAKPKWVGICIFSDWSNKATAEILCKTLKAQNPDQKIVVGGPSVIYLGQSMKSSGLVDAYVPGEGEEGVLALLRQDWDHPALHGQLVSPTVPLDELPLADYSDLNFSHYNGRSPMSGLPIIGDEFTGDVSLYITGSRGCIRRCTFCDVELNWPKFRYRSGKNIAYEVLQLAKTYKVTRFRFADNLINGRVDVMKEMCEVIVEACDRRGFDKAPFSWMGHFICRKEQEMPEEIYHLMVKSGAVRVHVGIESGSEKVLKDMRKPVSQDDIEAMLKYGKRAGLLFDLLMQVGYPTETEQDFQQTLELLTRLVIYKDAIGYIKVGHPTILSEGTAAYKQFGGPQANDEHGDWAYLDNTNKVRIERYQRLKDHCLALGYEVVDSVGQKLREEYRNKYGGDLGMASDSSPDHIDLLI